MFVVKAAMAVWVTILRFMGDLPEPSFTSGGGDIKVWQQSCVPSECTFYWLIYIQEHVHL